MTIEYRKLRITSAISDALVARGHSVGFIHEELSYIDNIYLQWRFCVREVWTNDIVPLPKDRISVTVGRKTFYEHKDWTFNIEGIVTALIELVEVLKKEHASMLIRAASEKECLRLRDLYGRTDAQINAVDVPGHFSLTVYLRGEAEISQVISLYDELISERTD
jgi:hypothetical protein